MAGNELVLTGNFELTTLSGSLAEAVAEEMDGLGPMPFDRVKIPSGGGLAFEIPGDDPEQPESDTEILGIILDHHPVNAYWKEKFSGGNDQPDCSSLDGKAGLDRETGECKTCADCPFNKFGSDGNGKACKNMHRVYILRSGSPIPLLLTLPPTSLKSLRDYLGKRVVTRGLRCWEVFTKVKLQKERNTSGIVYSRAIFSKVGTLTPEQTKEVSAMAAELRRNNRTVDIQTDDFCEVQNKANLDIDYEEATEK